MQTFEELQHSYIQLFLENSRLKKKNEGLMNLIEEYKNQIVTDGYNLALANEAKNDLNDELTRIQKTLEIFMERALFNDGTLYTLCGVCDQMYALSRKSVDTVQGCLDRMVERGTLAKTTIDHIPNEVFYCSPHTIAIEDLDVGNL